MTFLSDAGGHQDLGINLEQPYYVILFLFLYAKLRPLLSWPPSCIHFIYLYLLNVITNHPALRLNSRLHFFFVFYQENLPTFISIYVLSPDAVLSLTTTITSFIDKSPSRCEMLISRIFASLQDNKCGISNTFSQPSRLRCNCLDIKLSQHSH